MVGDEIRLHRRGKADLPSDRVLPRSVAKLHCSKMEVLEPVSHLIIEIVLHFVLFLQDFFAHVGKI